MKRRTFLKLSAGTALSGSLAACGGSSDGGSDSSGTPNGQSPQTNAVVGWTQTALEAVRKAKPGPTVVARSMAIMYTCMYNTWCAYDAVALPTRPGRVARRPPAERTAANKAMAMSFAAHAALLDQFPGEKPTFDAYLKSLGYDPAQASAEPGMPPGLGATVARIEIDYCHTDGANQLGDLAPGGVPYADYTGYVPRNPPMLVGAPTPRESIPAPGNWQALTYTDATGVVRTPVFTGAVWSRIRPFALASSDQYRPGPPAAYGTAEFEEQTRRVIELQAGLTEEQKVIADYWADGPNSEFPPGHWLLHAVYVSERDRHGDDDIRMFFALSNALSDAAIAAWDAKRAYDSVRPITAVRYLMHGQTITGYGLSGPAAGLRQIPGETWVPYQPSTFPTPAFPEHVSGHSTFSAAAAEVLRRFTGSDDFGARYVRRARSMLIEPGLPASDLILDWATFSAAAEQAGLSRIYGGIHFDKGNTEGQTLGRQVGRQAFTKAQALWSGKA